MTQPKDIEGLRKVAEDARAQSPDPWFVDRDQDHTSWSGARVIAARDAHSTAIAHTTRGWEGDGREGDSSSPALANFIATFNPARVSALLSELEAVKGERDDQVRQLVALRLNRLAHGDLCRLSVMFGRSSDLRTDQDIRINEWLKAQIADAKGEL